MQIIGKKIAFRIDLVFYIEQMICWSWALSAFGYVVTVRDCNLHSCFPFVSIKWAVVPKSLNIFVEQWNATCCILKCQGTQYKNRMLQAWYEICTCIIMICTPFYALAFTSDRMKHICVSRLTIIVLDNGLSPGRHQAFIWINAGILLIGPFGTNVSEILPEKHIFSFMKTYLIMPSGKWRPFCVGLNVLNVFPGRDICQSRSASTWHYWHSLIWHNQEFIWHRRELTLVSNNKAWRGSFPIRLSSPVVRGEITTLRLPWGTTSRGKYIIYDDQQLGRDSSPIFQNEDKSYGCIQAIYRFT